MEVTLETLKECMGRDAEEFTKVVNIVENIIASPEDYTGLVALKYATQLAAYRTKIGIKAQYYKTSPDKSLNARRTKDVLMTMYNALEENINCLKILGRIDAKAVSNY